ncbi:unnamed protein product [Protopolystoma xenopodis]|uniref:Uncharacterized protein n=1 Tax=Protopolystoma xenopodis TaxID=117903 RepID=A0A448XQV4_9PLAT|nr:unnamed protein product [Protopolystoma xenopodis]
MSVAVGVFNFLNWENRYVAGAFIPPSRLDVHDSEDRITRRLTAQGTELELAMLEASLPLSRLKLPFIPEDNLKGLPMDFTVRQSPLIGGPVDTPGGYLAEPISDISEEKVENLTDLLKTNEDGHEKPPKT